VVGRIVSTIFVGDIRRSPRIVRGSARVGVWGSRFLLEVPATLAQIDV